MAILQNRRTVFSLSNSEVMSNSAPSTEAGITKSEGHDGFFIYSDKAFTLWFKDQGGSWSSYNTYNSVDLSDGVAFSWGDNTAAFIQTNEVAHSIAVFIIETKEVGQYKNVENRTLNEAGFGRLDIHSNYKRVRMQNSGHTGEAYAIAIFDENGEAAYVSAPPSGQREGKALGWDENGNLGWITLAADDAVISELASVVNAQSNGTLGQGATVVNGMYINPNTRGQGYVQGTWTNDMRPDNSADDFSFSGYWRIKTANDNDRGWLFGREGSVSAGGWGIFLKKRTATTVAYEIVMSGGNPTFITDDITTNVFDEFHHVSFTYSNGEWKFYHDGTLVYTKTGVNMPTTNPSGGKYKLGNGWAVMALDEINLFKGTYLSTSQITSLAGERSQKDTDYTNNT